jgi:hypothetical protein
MRRAARWVLIAGAVVAALAVIVRLVLDPIATHVTRQGLARMEGMRGNFERVHVTLFSPGYSITRLKLVPEHGGDGRTPVFYAEAAHVGLDWHQLLHGRLAAHARIVEPKVSIIAGARPAPPSRKAPRPPDLSVTLQKITPLKIDRVEILRGEILFRDVGQPGQPELWVHRLELAAENLATRRRLSGARPTTVSASGVVGRSGAMRLFVSADAFASPLAFSGRFDVTGLRVTELFDFIEPKTKLQAPEGTLDLFAEFRVRGGRIEGGVKPILKGVEVRPADDSFGTRVKGWLADVGLDLASDRVPGRQAVATVVPIEGRLTKPDIQLWPAILGVVRNAFVAGVAGGFENLPPEEAPEKQGKVTQARQALQKSKGPPKAQPSAPAKEPAR